MVQSILERQSIDKKIEKKSISIIILDRAGQEFMRYNFYEAWPCKWKAPTLDSKGDTNNVEEIEICYERMEVVSQYKTLKQPINR